MISFQEHIEQFKQENIKHGRGSMKSEVYNLVYQFEFNAKSKAVKFAMKKLRTKINYLK